MYSTHQILIFLKFTFITIYSKYISIFFYTKVILPKQLYLIRISALWLPQESIDFPLNLIVSKICIFYPIVPKLCIFVLQKYKDFLSKFVNFVYLPASANNFKCDKRYNFYLVLKKNLVPIYVGLVKHQTKFEIRELLLQN